MPRCPRIKLADMSQHAAQRRTNSEPCFYAEEVYHCHLARDKLLRPDACGLLQQHVAGIHP